MPYYTRIALGLVLIGASTASAQIAPGGGMPGAGQQQEEQKKEGVAEAAPKATGLLPTTPALPPPKGRRKRWKLFEIDGYYRLRTDWFKNFHLGHTDFPGHGGTAFPRALSCSSNQTRGAGCDDALSSTNMRLRLEPTINLDEGTSIHLQADVLDNLVLGSTPIGENLGAYSSTSPPPFGAFSNGQGAVQAGVNSDRDSITIKRAWAEVAVPLGILKAGRQPNHWGMGIWHNAGGHDPINGTYDLDADYGDTVDRVSFSALIPGTNLRAMIASDWNLTRLVSNQTNVGAGREGHPWDLDDKDDSNSWVAVISRMDSPQELRDKVERGDASFNYGVYFEYRTQDYDYNLTDFEPGGAPTPFTSFAPRSLTMYSPDVWARFSLGKVTLEAEGLAQFGSVSVLERNTQTGAESLVKRDIRKFGGTARVSWRGLEGKLRLGVEGGAASGDPEDNPTPGNTHYTLHDDLGGSKISRLVFNREFKVDMILFRHLIGAVTNAGYVKPFLSYDLTKSISFRVANVTSFALKPVATPGNKTMYGTEFNADIGYAAGGLFAGFSYGVLFPFGALAHPAELGYLNNDDGNNQGDASTAHTIQSRLVLKF